MELIQAADQKERDTLWHFSPLDVQVKKMVIKGIWLFDYHLDSDKLKTSLSNLLSHYPTLTGRMEDARAMRLNNMGVGFSEASKKMKIGDLREIKAPLDVFNEKWSTKKFLSGKQAPIQIRITHIDDGSILNIHCAHVCMDGHGFFSFMDNWSKIHREIPIAAPSLKLPQTLNDIPSRDETEELVKQNNWKPVSFKSFLKFIWQQITGVSRSSSPPIFISNDDLQNLKKSIQTQRGKRYGTHAVLSALTCKMCYDLNNLDGPGTCSQVTVADIRGRIKGLASNYMANAVSNIPTPDFSSDLEIGEMAKIIDRSVRSIMNGDPKTLIDHVRLNVAAAHYKLPFTPFDLDAMNNPQPTCFYINNFLKFPMYEVDFGEGKATGVLPNDLPDAIKFWPASIERDGIYIYLRGYLARNYDKVKDKRAWIDQFLAKTMIS